MKNLNRFIGSFAVGLVFVFLANVTLAQTTAPAVGTKTTQTRPQVAGNTLQARATAEIERRITKLSQALVKLNTLQNLTPETRTSLSTQIQTEIDALNALKAQVATADTTTLRTQVGTVVSSYKTYALFVPKVMIITTAQRLLNIADLLTSAQQSLLQKVSALSVQGTDVADLETLLTDAEESISNARVSAQSAVDTVADLTPTGYPDNRTSLQSARTALVTAREALLSARQSLGGVVSGLATLNSGTTTQTETLQTGDQSEAANPQDVMTPQ